jgi:hypothetical protein
VGQEVADLNSRIAPRLKWFDWAEQRIFCDIAASHHLAEAFRQWFAGEFCEIGLGIKQVDLTWAAVHKQPDHSLGARREVRLTRSEWIRGGMSPLVGEQAS